jgi:FkbM family methyltransferase
MEVNCVLDVGAHEGGYAGFLRDDVGFSGYIISFEPTLSSFTILQNRMAKDAKWRGWRWAMGSQSGVTEINLFTNRRFDSLLQATSLGKEHMRATGTEVVDVRRLDEVFAEVTEHIRRPVVLLKTDTQGFDLSVIEGADGVLARIPVLQAEVPVQPLYEGAPSLTEFLTSVGELGFDLTGAFPVGRDRWLRILDMDCLFISRPG